MTLLEVDRLSKSYAPDSESVGWGTLHSRRPPIQVLRNVSISLARGETLGLVGESGCGKSTLARCILGIERPDSGAVRIEGKDLHRMARRELRQCRRKVSVVFQDPWQSLNPKMPVEAIVEEPLIIHRLGTHRERRERVAELLRMVGLAELEVSRLPAELSGGQRQRVAIARALACRPELLIADEPLSALDAPIQAQILDLFLELRERLDLTVLFITHGLDTVRSFCQRVTVMRRGEVVETAPVAELFENPRHDYTRRLLDAARW